MKAVGIFPNYFCQPRLLLGRSACSLSSWGPERASRIDPLRSTMDAGLDFCLHSDLPVTPIDPLFSIHTAVNRATRNGKVLGPDQRIPVRAALKAYTTTAAYVSLAEHEKGVIAPGFLADFVVLSENP